MLFVCTNIALKLIEKNLLHKSNIFKSDKINIKFTSQLKNKQKRRVQRFKTRVPQGKTKMYTPCQVFVPQQVLVRGNGSNSYFSYFGNHSRFLLYLFFFFLHRIYERSRSKIVFIEQSRAFCFCFLSKFFFYESHTHAHITCDIVKQMFEGNLFYMLITNSLQFNIWQ